MKRKCEDCGASWPPDWDWYPKLTCPFCDSENIYEEDDHYD